MQPDDYFGLISGPSQSHGGGLATEVPDIIAIQQQLIFADCVPGIRDVHDDWSDGKFEAPTAAAVRRFRAKFGLRPVSWGHFHRPLWVKLMDL
jgi:peptidoglycan hydrolase-like protein with peptidoglycan-binding domain